MPVLRGCVGLVAVALLAAGCGEVVRADPAGPTASSTPGPTATPSATPSPAPDGRLVGSATVIDRGTGPSLCFIVLQSLPPQCGGGVDLAGWQWPDRGTERRGKTTWGDFAVVGRYDGQRFTVEKTVDPATLPPPVDEPLLGTPCPEPVGGWHAPDPARATQQTQDEALQRAARLPGYADAWVDERGEPGNPLVSVLNFSFTRDPAGAERALREVWGGSLCVSRAERTHTELDKIQRELGDTPRVLSGSFGFGHVDLQIVHDDGTLQRRLDEKYGPGLVRVESALQPYQE